MLPGPRLCGSVNHVSVPASGGHERLIAEKPRLAGRISVHSRGGSVRRRSRGGSCPTYPAPRSKSVLVCTDGGLLNSSRIPSSRTGCSMPSIKPTRAFEFPCENDGERTTCGRAGHPRKLPAKPGAPTSNATLAQSCPRSIETPSYSNDSGPGSCSHARDARTCARWGHNGTSSLAHWTSTRQPTCLIGSFYAHHLGGKPIPKDWAGQILLLCLWSPQQHQSPARQHDRA